MHGYPLVPRLAFFETHTPSIPDLSQMHILLKEKDCRNSIIGRRRIMEGRNAISSACATECLERSRSRFRHPAGGAYGARPATQLRARGLLCCGRGDVPDSRRVGADLVALLNLAVKQNNLFRVLGHNLLCASHQWL